MICSLIALMADFTHQYMLTIIYNKLLKLNSNLPRLCEINTSKIF